jgi:DNA polymerase I-like protein with 3'-5' exonuclease and polymerase domains
MSYLVFDIETTYGEHAGRVGSRWADDYGLCSTGFKFQNKPYYGEYYVKGPVDDRYGLRPGEYSLPDLTGIKYLIGHNIKFDLIWYWDDPELIKFFENGGKVWDTMYAEYLLSGQFYSMQSHAKGLGISLKDCAKRRGLDHQKLDMVAALWDQGVRTEDIDEEILMEYLMGDVLTTEDLFLAQVAQARKQGQVVTIQQRMDGLLATTEMEFNGMQIDQKAAEEQMAALEKSIQEHQEELEQYIPELPTGCEFNWGSWRNVSALIFGGELKYKGTEYSLDSDGNLQYYKKKIREKCLDDEGNPIVIKSGKNAGKVKTRLVSVDDIERGPKTRKCNAYFTLPGMAEPKDKWKSSVEGYYSTAEDVLEEVAEQGVPFVEKLLELKGMSKDLGTYYKRFTKGKWTGMLTNIQPDGKVHGHLNHAITATARLSSSKPNLQNIPKEGKSEVKRVFVSSFPDGFVAEADYSQLEVVGKGVLSKDKALLQALKDGVCFHCEWCAFVHDEDYDYVYEQAKILKSPEWKKKRQDVKPITFGEAYGAGVGSLSASSGVEADLIEKAIKARKEKYHMMYAFDDAVAEAVANSRKPTPLRTDDGYQKAVGYYRSVTGTIYSFVEVDAPEWKKDQGQFTAFMPTQMKNYPSQGIGGEIMQVMSGRLWRKLVELRLRDRLKLMNTVHDSVYIDCENETVAKKYLPKIKTLLEDVSPYFTKTYKDVEWDTEFPVDIDYGKNLLETPNSIEEGDPEWIQ